METQSLEKFSMSAALSNSITGKSSISALSAFIALIVGSLMFIIIVVRCICTDNVDYISHLITLAVLSVGLAGMGSVVLFGNKNMDSKEVIANMTSMLPDNSITSKIKSTITSIETSEQKKSE